MRHCRECRRNLNQSSYSKNQWSKGVGVSRCSACVHGRGGAPANDFPETARKNDATEATFTAHDLDNPFAEGNFRWVAKGEYTCGQREGEPCVCKWFKSGGVFEKEFFSLDIKAVEKATDLIREWNAAGVVDKVVRMNVPEVWTFKKDSGEHWAGRKVLQEPFIENWEKFNSNTGWTDDDMPWGRVMQALSHFSYHSSGGQFVLCDLQGGIYADGIVLTDPVILSRRKQYGVTDLGPEGISTFFARHECNEFCRSSWSKPRDARVYFDAQHGTSMMSGAHHVPTRPTRPMMSAAVVEHTYGDYDDYSDGERVIYKHSNGSRYLGRICYENSDGTFDVDDDDGERAEYIDTDRLMRVEEGTRVQYLHNNGHWYWGEITYENHDGSFDVVDDDGEKVEYIGIERLRRT